MMTLTVFGSTDSEAKTKEYKYYENNSDGIEITKYTGKKKKVTVPAKIDGKDVVSVTGFSRTHVTSVTIPNSVTSIGGSAFWNCKKLKR